MSKGFSGFFSPGLPLFDNQVAFGTETLVLIMRACVIIHNMIVEDERDIDPEERFDYGDENVQPSHGIPTRTLAEFIEAHKKI
jgi:hypothetical protein